MANNTKGLLNGLGLKEEHKKWLLIAVVFYVLWKFKGFLAPLTGLAGTLAETVQIKASAAQAAVKKQADKAKSVYTATSTDQDVEAYRVDAMTIATALGTSSSGFGGFFASGTEDEQAAWNVLKKYTKNLTRNGKVIGKRAAKYTAPALEPFYKEVTGGRGLKADCFKLMNEAEYAKLLPLVW